MAATSTKPARYPALRHRNFTLIWTGLIVSNMGTWMQNVAQSWLIYKMTGNDALFLGYLGLSFAIPMTFLPPIGGVIVDRVDRVRLLYFTQSGAAISAAVMAVFVWAGWLQPWHILLVSFFQALLLAFDNPARQSLIPELVPRTDLLNALSLNSATYTGAALVGPAIAGILLALTGPAWLYLLNAVSYLAVIFALFAMRDMPPRPRRTTTMREALFGGVLFIVQHKLILLMLILSALAAVFGRSYQQLLPVFADDVWQVGSGGYGQLLSAVGGGALIGAFALSSLSNFKAHGRLMVASGLLFCLTLSLFSLTPWFGWGVVLLTIVGVSTTVFTTMISTTIQLRTPNEVRGRVMSFYAATLIGLPSFGSLGIAAFARSLAGDATTPLSRAALAVLNGLGVTQATAGLGGAAGAVRAIVLGALVVALVILVAAPSLLPIRAPTVVGGD
ncbi:MAG: MFS transporter [Anaerolineae bacterium]|nr:MFS transporter [Anaerolineae bacterium]